jgi:hypothetical protein
MRFSKRVLFGDDPQDDHLRPKLVEQARQVCDTYVHKIPTRRKNRFVTSPRWDPAWDSCLTKAVRDLTISYRHITSQICFLSETDREAVRTKAEELHTLAVEQWNNEPFAVK